MLELWQQLAAAAIGSGVGLVSGLFGVGGGFLLVPLLNILVGIPMSVAVGSAACQVLGPTTTALLARRLERDDLRLPLMLVVAQVLGIYGGGKALYAIKDRGLSIGDTTLGVDHAVLIVYFVLLVGIGGFGLFEVFRRQAYKPVEIGWLQRLPIPPRVWVGTDSPRRLSIPLLGWFGVAVGFLCGLLGMSGGLVILPGLVYAFGMPIAEAARAPLVMVWLLSFQGTIVHGLHESIDLVLVGVLLLGGTVGAKIGSRLARRLPSSKLKENFGWLLLGTSGLILYRLVQSWPS